VPVQEIVIPKLSGVYMLGEHHHTFVKRVNIRGQGFCGDIYYIGQSGDVFARFKHHKKHGIANPALRNTASSRLDFSISNPRMVLLSDTGNLNSIKRELFERAFITAAAKMGLPLCNQQVFWHTVEDLEEKKRVLTEALDVFRELAKTAWPHPENFSDCRMAAC